LSYPNLFHLFFFRASASLIDHHWSDVRLGT
jgi:hypothetical protein